jgi:multidrug efflux pump subunit AcrA (membrane-fusion protein)
MKSLLRPPVVALILLGGVALASCGGDSQAGSPTSATSAPAAGQYVAFVGELKAVNGDMLSVGRDTVEANAYTLVFRNNVPITVSQLHIGESVRVKGFYNANATMIVARQIIVESEG